MSDTSAAPTVPRHFGRYTVVQALGGGAMGEVYRARDTVLGREVAIKVMRALGPDPATFRARFEAEARALASLQHPAAVQVFDVGWDQEQPYLVMELVEGGTLKGHLDAAPLSAGEVSGLGIQVGNALLAAHRLGILHRDIKPANILGRPGHWKLADFGIAHVPGSELTMTGQFLGTPAYAAPESLTEGEFSPASDVYGLGATLYAALTGEPPYSGPLGAVGATTLTPVARRAPAAPPALAAAITAALDRSAAQRPSVEALVQRLAAGERDAPPTAPGTGVSETPAPSSPAASVATRSLRAPAAARPPARWPMLAAIVAVAAIAVGLVARGDRGPAAPPIPSTPALTLDPTGLDQPLALPAQTAPRPPKLEKKWRDALRRAERGELDEAAEKLEQILRDDPGDTQARALYEELVRRGAQPHDDDDDKHGRD